MDRETQRVLNAVADFLKDIINQSNIPMILIGQQGEAEPILLTNPQLSRRVGTPRYLKPFPWEQTNPETITEFCTIIVVSGIAREQLWWYFGSTTPNVV
jgi:hypothetical protein